MATPEQVKVEVDPIEGIRIARNQLVINGRFGQNDSAHSDELRARIYTTAEEYGIGEDDLFEIIFEPEGWRERLTFNRGE